MIRSVLMLAPEAPYPLQGGGAYRTASLLHYFARFAAVDLILISENGQPALLPPGLVRSQTIVPLPVHRKGLAARYLRNASRVLRGVPPLIDRLSGLEASIARVTTGRSWDLGIVEHFWCAPYADQLKAVCGRTMLDLHNIESVLHRRCGAVEHGLVAAGHRRFAKLYEKLEAAYLPRYSLVLATSEPDASEVRRIAPQSCVQVFANSIPDVGTPRVAEQPWLVFSANFEYHPNIDAVHFLTSQIWPAVKAAHPELRLRLVGRGDASIRHLAPADSGIEITGPVTDAFGEIGAARIVLAPLRAGSGTRIKILEAWAAARPVIATPIAAEGLDIRDGDNILLAESPQAFLHAINRLLVDPKERQRVARNGRQTFESQYTWQAAWRTLDAHLQMPRCAELSGYTG